MFPVFVAKVAILLFAHRKEYKSFWVLEKGLTFAIRCITNEMERMSTTALGRPASFRLRSDLIDGLKRRAACENRTLNNYVESVLLRVLYDEPNEVTKAAIDEAMSRKSYPKEELYSSAEDMFKAVFDEDDAK